MIKLSAVVLTKNEETNILRCVKSLLFADEIIIVDDFSTDRTIDVIENLRLKNNKYKNKIKVFKRLTNQDIAEQRNYALTKNNGYWVLFVDADEVVTKLLEQEIKDLLITKDNKFNGYYIKRKDVFMDKQLKFGEAGNIKLLRLAKRNAGRWVRPVHETWQVKGEVGSLKNELMHFSHNNLHNFIESINNWSKLHAKANMQEGKRSTLIKILFLPVFKFKVNYFFKLGIKDGVHGFVFAMIMSFHSFLSWSTLWLIQKKRS